MTEQSAKAIDPRAEMARAERYLTKREERLKAILDDPERRERMLGWLLHLA